MIPELTTALRRIRLDPEISTEALRDLLYLRAFARGEGDPQLSPALPEAELGRRLSAANRSRDRWHDGWCIERVEAEGAIVARQGTLRRTARAGEYVTTFSRALPPRKGMAATLLFPRESSTLQANVYYAFGDALPAAEDEDHPVRVYLHAVEDSLPALYEHLTGALNEERLPFTLKTMLAATDRTRRDATVLYVGRRHRKIAERILRQLSEAVPLLPGVPLFTRALAPGIGWAESPGGGESFGMHRCRVMAEGIVDARRGGADDERSRLAAIERHFRAAGIDGDRPHLNGLVLDVGNVVSWLRRGGYIDGEELRVSDRSSRNRNFAVSRADGTGVFVKQLRVRGVDSLRMMEREAAVLRSLGCPAPSLIAFDPRFQTLVCELAANARRVAELPPSDVIAAAAARSLAILHARSIDDGGLFDRLPPGIYTAHRGGPLRQWLGPGQLQLIDAVKASAVLAPALDRMAAAWAPARLIHGDVKWENCLWTGERLVWTDWELADLGDPAWDAGSFLQAYLVRQTDELQPQLDTFLRRYQSATGASIEEIVRCAAARMIQTALEVMHGQPRPTPQSLSLLNRSEALMAHPTL